MPLLPMERRIEDAIRQLQAGSTRAPDDLKHIALATACTQEQYNLIASALYTVLDDAHLQASKTDKSLPVQQVLCLASLATIIPVRYLSLRTQSTLQTWALHWPELHRWILYLKNDFIDQEGVDLSFRLLAKKSIVDLLGLCQDNLLRLMFESVVASPGIITTLFSLWRLETLDRRFSLSDEASPRPRFHIPSILDGWMCAFSHRESWDWVEILRPFGGESDAIAATALDRLQQDVARTPINYDLVVWNIHLLTTLSVNEAIRTSILNQRSLTILTNIINSMVDRYASTNRHYTIARCISHGYWYIRAYVESTEGLPWVTQIVEAGLLSAMLSTEPWIKHLNGQDSEDWEPLFLLLGQIIPRYSVYGSVLKLMIRQLMVIDARGLPGKLEGNGLLHQSWTLFEHVVRSRAALYTMYLSNETHIESCQNTKCDKSGPPGSFKSCAGCLHVHYCSKECQVYDWKNGHQKYCRDIQARRASGLVSRLSRRNVHFIDRVIAHDLNTFRDRIQATATLLNANPVVAELDYTELPREVDIGSIHSVAQIQTCQCDAAIAQKWNHMIELAQKSTSKRMLIRAFLPAGASEKVKLQCLPLKRVLGEDTAATDEDTISDFDETFDLLYSRVGQSLGIVDAAFPNEAMRAMKEKSGYEG